jgi:tetratricopeptide (TPR) repeat protein
MFSNLARGKYEKALELSNKVISDYPDHPNSILTRVLVYGYNIIHNYNEKDANTDIFFQSIDNLIQLDPIKFNKSRYYQFKSYVLTKLKMYGEAIDALNTAIDLDPNRLDLNYSRNKILLLNNEGEKAIQIIDALIDKFPQKHKSLLKLQASTYSKIGNPEEGLKILEELLEEYHEDKGLMNNCAIMLAQSKKKEEAIEMAKRQISLAPQEGNAYDTYGEILLEFGHYDDAIIEFKKALDIEPGGWFAIHTYTKLGVCYTELKKYNLAEKHLLKACDLEDRLLPNEILRDLYDPHFFLAKLRKLKELAE